MQNTLYTAIARAEQTRIDTMNLILIISVLVTLWEVL